MFRSSQNTTTQQFRRGQGVYSIPTFFVALHWILVEIIPPNRPLKEYLQMYLIIQRLLSRFFRSFTPQHSAEIPNKINLLVVLHTSASTIHVSQAAIGFSATVKDKVDIMQGRHAILKELTTVKQHHYAYQPGNCAEAETYAWFKRTLPGYKGARFLTVTSTLNLLEGTPEPICGQCKDLTTELRKWRTGLYTLDLRPFRQQNTPKQSHQEHSQSDERG